MKVVSKILLYCIMFYAGNTSAQTVYQHGNYQGQRRPEYIKLRGVITNKYINKRLRWIFIDYGDKHLIVSVVDARKFESLKLNTSVKLDSCFLLDSNKWKR
ncbi:hypothetical protein ACTJKC_15170 [Pedobacter sp. 22226]|uniref:hypothetical protein n=1 Tax=Pedobacter sp. 22226 TaxID=3453894 RepID=UPI003F86CF2E